MMKFLKKLFSTEEKATEKIDNSDLDIAIIAILLRASSIDGNKDDLELDMIKVHYTEKIQIFLDQ